MHFQPQNQVPNGDYASYVEALTGAPPGKVQERPARSKSTQVDVTPWFVAFLQACVFAGLAYAALSQEAISLASRRGEHLYQGRAAVWVGFGLLGFAFLAALRPFRFSRIFRPLGLLLFALWSTAVVLRLVR